MMEKKLGNLVHNVSTLLIFSLSLARQNVSYSKCLWACFATFFSSLSFCRAMEAHQPRGEETI